MISARVLIVEDERIVAMQLEHQLSRLGYEVAAMATRGEQALAHIARHRPDVVLMDIHIEGDIDGIETAGRIPDDYQTAVIYLTGYSEAATLDRARLTRPYAYLLKPFSEDELHAALQMVMERRRTDIVTQDQRQQLAEDLARETGERVAAEQAFLHVQKMEAMGQLTGAVAHDFNNLMQITVGNLEMLARGPLTDTAQNRRFVEGALKGAKRAAGLTQRLLAFARRQPLEAKPTDVNAMLLETSDLLRRALTESISLHLKLQAHVWPVNVDRNQLENALLNLAINARDAMPAGGEVTLETSVTTLERDQPGGPGHLAPGDYVVITLTDGGVGMDAHTLAHALEPFFTTKAAGEYSGLGLAQVYAFIKQSGGNVTLTSTPGAGTTARIYLPRHGEPLASAASEGASCAEMPPATETILVVEDDPDVRAFSVIVLRDLGYRVLEAGDGRAALEMLSHAATPIDLLFTDVVMPGGLNGPALVALAMQRFPRLKILYASGYSRDAIAHGGQVETGVELITKPFTFEQLAARIRAVLSKGQVPTAH